MVTTSCIVARGWFHHAIITKERVNEIGVLKAIEPQ